MDFTVQGVQDITLAGMMAKDGDIDVGGDDAKIVEFIGKTTEGIRKEGKIRQRVFVFPKNKN